MICRNRFTIVWVIKSRCWRAGSLVSGTLPVTPRLPKPTRDFTAAPLHLFLVSG